MAINPSIFSQTQHNFTNIKCTKRKKVKKKKQRKKPTTEYPQSKPAGKITGKNFDNNLIMVEEGVESEDETEMKEM